MCVMSTWINKTWQKSLIIGISQIKDFFHLCMVIKEYETYRNMLKRISIVLIMAFVIQVANNVLFFHSHKTADRHYSHAHPNCGTHSHNDFQYHFYDQLKLLSHSINADLLKVCSFEQQYSYKCYALDLFTNEITFHISGRAPPIC